MDEMYQGIFLGMTKQAGAFTGIGTALGKLVRGGKGGSRAYGAAVEHMGKDAPGLVGRTIGKIKQIGKGVKSEFSKMTPEMKKKLKITGGVTAGVGAVGTGVGGGVALS